MVTYRHEKENRKREECTKARQAAVRRKSDDRSTLLGPDRSRVLRIKAESPQQVNRDPSHIAIIKQHSCLASNFCSPFHSREEMIKAKSDIFNLG
jgi:hypothetical protein